MLVTSKDIPFLYLLILVSRWRKWNTQAELCVFHLNTMVAGYFTLLAPNFAVSMTAVESLAI